MATALLEHPAVDAPRFGGAGAIAGFGTWRGRSGRRYVVSIYPVATCPDYEFAVALAVRRGPGDDRDLLHAADLGPLPALVLAGQAFAAARRDGAEEIHLHLLAPDAVARRRALADLTEPDRA